MSIEHKPTIFFDISQITIELSSSPSEPATMPAHISALIAGNIPLTLRYTFLFLIKDTHESFPKFVRWKPKVSVIRMGFRILLSEPLTV